jgi:hypothetical protein
MTQNLSSRYQQLLASIQIAQQKSHLATKAHLIAVSKYATTEQVRALYALGQRDFGENYWQSAKEKLIRLQDCDISWHFIGQLQKNKLADIAKNFAWVHSLAKINHVELLAKHRENLSPLRICLQVNLSNDTNKYGVIPNALIELIQTVQQYPTLSLQGLMILPKPGNTTDFLALADLRDQLQHQLQIKLPDLSMGMSDNYIAAIKAGATWIRIGSALFNN